VNHESQARTTPIAVLIVSGLLKKLIDALASATYQLDVFKVWNGAYFIDIKIGNSIGLERVRGC